MFYGTDHNNNTETWCDRHAAPRSECGCKRRTTTTENGLRGQVRIAYRLADTYGGHLIHVNGIGWHTWDGTRWTEDTTGAAKRAVLDVLQQALAESLHDRELRDDVRKCETSAGINGVLDIATALQPFAHSVTELDADPYLLNTATGTLDLRTLELRPHDPGDLITKRTRAAFVPDAHGIVWEAFLDTSLPDVEVQEFLRRYVGLGLLGRVREHVLAIMTGQGRNGKGVFYGALAYALGDYASTAEPELFLARPGANPAGEMDLRGARWVVVSESDSGRRLAQATMKRLTGGDTIKARRLYANFVEFTPSHTVAMVTNHLPVVNGNDPAVWARLRVVPFTQVIPPERQDKNLPEKLQLEADAILRWAVDGWRAYEEHGLAEPPAVLAATATYRADSDAILRFIESECVTVPGVSATTRQLFTRWEAFATRDGADRITEKAFGQALDDKGFPARKTKVGMLRNGIGLAVNAEVTRGGEGW